MSSRFCSCSLLLIAALYQGSYGPYCKRGKDDTENCFMGSSLLHRVVFCFQGSTVVRRADIATFIVHLFSPQLLLSAMHVFHLAFKCTVPKIADK